MSLSLKEKMTLLPHNQTWFDLPHRNVIAIEGEDAFSFVRNIFSNHPSDQTPTKNLYLAALLKAQGQVISDVLMAAPNERSILCEVDANQASDIVSSLNLYRLKAKISIKLTDLIVQMKWSADFDNETSLDHEWGDPRGALMLNITHLKRRYVASTMSQEKLEAVQFWREMRHENGLIEYGDCQMMKPVYLIDINLDLWGGVDFQKGCFIGQEMTSRMKRRGQIKNRLVGLRRPVTNKAINTDYLRQNDTSIGEIIAQTQDQIWLANLRIDRYQSDQPIYLGDHEVTVSGIALQKKS